MYYFNLVLLKETLVTLLVAHSCFNDNLDAETIIKIEQYLKTSISSYKLAAEGTDILRNIISFIDEELYGICNSLRYRTKYLSTEKIPLDFIPNFCVYLQKNVKWMTGRPIYFFLDDYSLPHVSQEIQKNIHDIIFYRWPSCYFKIATESITTIYPYDSIGKLLEETREYDVIDLGSYFIKNPSKDDESSEDRKKFLLEVINNRLKLTDKIHSDYKDISKILGPNPYKSYNKLALQIRREEPGKVYYAGFETITDLFSGDIADILRLVRNILYNAGGLKSLENPGFNLPISPEVQDKAMREYGANFLGRVESAPNTGPQMRHVAEIFGKTANWSLKNRDSKNQDQNPPWQAFRIEVRERFTFDDREQLLKIYKQLVFPGEREKIKFEDFLDQTRSVYRDLLRYGIFLRDIRGKSQRSAIAPRLYLRRLLIPSFVITPNQRDNIGLEVWQFFDLLFRPDRFYANYTSGKAITTGQEKQGTFFE